MYGSLVLKIMQQLYIFKLDHFPILKNNYFHDQLWPPLSVVTIQGAVSDQVYNISTVDMFMV